MYKATTFCFLILVLELPGSFAAGNTLQAEIKAYNKANYQQVVAIGNKLIMEQPDNAMARYYLANAYSRLDLLPEAIKQYTFCTTMADDPTIRTYAKQALSVLKHYSDGANQSSGWVNPAHFASAASSSAYQMSPDEVNQDLQNVQSEAGELNHENDLTQRGDLVGAQYAEATRIDTVRSRTVYNMGLAPYSGYGGYGYGGGGYGGAPVLPVNAQLRIDGAQHYFGQVLPWQINRDFNKKKQALNDSVSGLQQQLQGDGGDGVQLSSQGTNLYVRNYIDDQSVSPPEPPVVTGMKCLAKGNNPGSL